MTLPLILFCLFTGLSANNRESTNKHSILATIRLILNKSIPSDAIGHIIGKLPKELLRSSDSSDFSYLMGLVKLNMLPFDKITIDNQNMDEVTKSSALRLIPQYFNKDTKPEFLEKMLVSAAKNAKTENFMALDDVSGVRKYMRESALFSAFEAKNYGVINYIFAKYPDSSNWQNPGRKGIAHLASIENDKEVAKLLQSIPSTDYNRTCAIGNTPLHWAALRGNKEVFDILIQSGADPEIVNDRGVSPHNIASKRGWLDETSLGKCKRSS